MKAPLFADYKLEPGTYDESWQEEGHIQPHWRPFVESIQGRDLPHMRQSIQRLLQENGVTYNVHGEQGNQPRPWKLDVVPLIIQEDDWQEIEAGIQQRAELLNFILADLYGAQRLIRDRLIPPELVYMHEGFLRPCMYIDNPHNTLTFYAADLGRGPDGRMWVLGDRTQAPSGTGYALENRTVMTRVMGDMFEGGHIRRLASFFRQFQNTLHDMAFNNRESPQVVVLTPGPYSETYFEHAYLASYLGFSLVQGNDLTVRDGHVWLKTIEGLKPVDVVLRRVDDSFCDPLELRDYSQLGVAGLLETVRRQNVAVANPLGSSILENPGLMPFLPSLSKHFLGEDLRLPAAATWWCGQDQELEYVLENLPNLVIKRISRTAQSRTVFGRDLSKKQLADLRERIKARPHLYVGQQQVSFSTVPSLVNGHFEARHTILRTFAVTSPEGYVVMPGGLTRSAAEPSNFLVTGRESGISRDTWVMTSQQQAYSSLWLQGDRLKATLKRSFSLPSRAAENLFWVGRYAERAEATARLLRTILNDSLQSSTADDTLRTAVRQQLLRALTQMTLTYPGFVGPDAQPLLAKPNKEIRAVALDVNRVGSLAYNVQALARAAFAVRDLWSNDSWRVIEGIDEHWSRLYKQKGRARLTRVGDQLNPLITQLMAFSGLNLESMTQGYNWVMLDAGRRLERAQLTISLVRSLLTIDQGPRAEGLLLEILLLVTENIITYRRRYRSYLHIHTVLDQLLLDPTNPRALLYQLNQLQTHLEKLPRQLVGFRLSDEERLVLDASNRLRLSDLGQLITTHENQGSRQELDNLLGEMSRLLADASQAITHFYFNHAQVPQPLVSAVTNQLDEA